MEQLCVSQTVQAEKIQRSISNGKKQPLDRRTVGFYENKYAELKTMWEHFDNEDTKLRELMATSGEICDHAYIVNDVYSTIEIKYIEYLGDLTDGLAGKGNITTSLNNSSVNCINNAQTFLPRITLPKFDGSYSTWQSFRDLFVSVIDDNEALSPVQKLHHLKGCLIGEAERLLRHFPITNENYEPAWERLRLRYENKRVLVNTQLQILTGQAKIVKETSKSIKMLMDTTQECLQQLTSLKINILSWDTLLIHLLVQKLPFETLKLWEEELGASQELPTMEQFQKFLQTRFRVLESMSHTLASKPLTQISKVYHTTYSNRCPACGQGHFLGTCQKFLKMEIGDRRKCIQDANRCFNCLSSKHQAKKCTSTNRCKICKSAHHSLLHPVITSAEGESATGAQAKGANEHREGNTAKTDGLQSFFTHTQDTLLATAVVEVEDTRGERVSLRCLIDPGSQPSFVTRDVCQRLGLQGEPTSLEITGINEVKAAQSSEQVNLVLHSCYNNKSSLQINMLVIDKISAPLPATTVKTGRWKHLKGLKLADTTYWQPRSIDILLGANVYDLVGPQSDSEIHESTAFLATSNSTELLNQQLKKFWEIEEVSREPIVSPEDEECERLFQSTHQRLETGQYQVHLPFKNQTLPTFGPSRQLALKRFLNLRHKLQYKPEFEEQYANCLNEYITLVHMEKIKPQINPTANEYYIPHHAVCKESSTTRVRVVFDASAKSCNGRSLNEQLLIGPTIQEKLSSVLLRFRKHKIAMMADIEKMYRMVLVHPEHRAFQRIIWQDPTTRVIEDYQLRTLTFGTASAPFLAIRTLQQLAHDEAENFPLAAKIVKSEFYVDDMLTGADTVEEALDLQLQCINMLKAGHFHLRKWSSNNLEVLKSIPYEHRELKGECKLQENEVIKTLGIQWCPAGDYFTFSIHPERGSSILSKRSILSKVASLYDPMGWIAPVIIVAKLLIQTLWITGCSWDDEVNEIIKTQWRNFKDKINSLEHLRIPRWIGMSKDTTNIHVHGFCDASNKAYAAVVYIRIEDKITELLTAKTKVAPIRPTTTPRLELNGALLLARLLKSTVRDLQHAQNLTITAWTDSMVVLQWIKSHPSKWKTYVANRIAEIQQIIKPENWRYVPTADNPADVASRGSLADELVSNHLWWHGPPWLVKEECKWPRVRISSNQPQLEEKTSRVSLHTTVVCDILERYSSLTKLIRIIAFIQRFFHNTQPNQDRRKGALTREELTEAHNTICKVLQSSAFPYKIESIRKNKPLPKKSKLATLTPIFGTDKLLRVGGRLEFANLPYSRKHPIILPAEHHVVNLISEETHRNTLHGGVGLVLNTTRNRYWIIEAKRIISKRINRCKTGIAHRQQTRAQLMGNLPASRVTISKPFSHVGIDYAGPILLKTSPHRTPKTYKGYFCIYVCMATKATHLELVSDMTADGFIAALKRFIARRGLCTDIYSDCGTNFKGAQNKLEIDLRKAMETSSSEISRYLQTKNIVWHFNPPASPHFGGLWEAGVKSVKYHLQRVIGKSVYTYEEYATILAQIESCVNSRPLCPIENSIEDLEVLTPADFIVGQTLNAVPEPEINEHKTSLNRRWKHVQYVTQQFWNKWSKDYLNRLQQRPKWLRTSPNLKVGDIVLIKNENTAPTYWPLGRVEQVFPGTDGLVRVVQVKTRTSTLKRPVVKLCRLPMEDEAAKDDK